MIRECQSSQTESQSPCRDSRSVTGSNRLEGIAGIDVSVAADVRPNHIPCAIGILARRHSIRPMTAFRLGGAVQNWNIQRAFFGWSILLWAVRRKQCTAF
jgi:hypothetical protein